jgi:hypothetical protein
MRFARVLAFAFSLLPACGSGPGTGSAGSGGGGGGDGKYHPPGNGVAMSEADACNALSTAQDAENSSLMCASTSYPCPALLRAQFTTSCLEYDQGSVQGCVAYDGMATTCAELATAIADCAVTPIDGSAPKGCP